MFSETHFYSDFIFLYSIIIVCSAYATATQIRSGAGGNLFIVKENGVSRNKLHMIRAPHFTGSYAVFLSGKRILLVNDWFEGGRAGVKGGLALPVGFLLCEANWPRGEPTSSLGHSGPLFSKHNQLAHVKLHVWNPALVQPFSAGRMHLKTWFVKQGFLKSDK